VDGGFLHVGKREVQRCRFVSQPSVHQTDVVVRVPMVILTSGELELALDPVLAHLEDDAQ
jgi:hypothetical protein